MKNAYGSELSPSLEEASLPPSHWATIEPLAQVAWAAASAHGSLPALNGVHLYLLPNRALCKAHACALRLPLHEPRSRGPHIRLVRSVFTIRAIWLERCNMRDLRLTVSP